MENKTINLVPHNPDQYKSVREKQIKSIEQAKLHLKEVTEACNVFKETKCPTGLFKYRNDLDSEIRQREKFLK